MSNQDAVIVLENLRIDTFTCRTEKEALDIAISVLKLELKKEKSEDE